MRTMSTNHAKFSLGYHIIWCSKYRHQILKDAIEVELKQVLAETCSHYEWKLESLEIMPDHVHIFVQSNPQTAPVERDLLCNCWTHYRGICKKIYTDSKIT